VLTVIDAAKGSTDQEGAWWDDGYGLSNRPLPRKTRGVHGAMRLGNRF